MAHTLSTIKKKAVKTRRKPPPDGRSTPHSEDSLCRLLSGFRSSYPLFPGFPALPSSRNDCKISVAATYLQLGGVPGGHGRLHTGFRGLRDWSAAHPTYGWASRSTCPVRRRRPGFLQLAGSTRRRGAEDSPPRCRPRHNAEPAVPANAGRPSMCCGCCAFFPGSALAEPSSPIHLTRPLRCGGCPRRARESGDEGRIPDSCSRFDPGVQLNAPRRARRVTSAANSRPVQSK